MGRSGPKPRKELATIGMDGIPERPAFLSKNAAKKWDEVTQLMSGLGVLSPADADCVGVYADTWTRYVEAKGLTDEERVTFTRRLLKLQKQLLLTPASRAVVKRPPVKREESAIRRIMERTK